MNTMMSSNEIRDKFLNYFSRFKHEIVPSSSLIPFNDATLLFTNAGMVQFKDVFLGLDKRPYARAVTAQRCVRAGGKHNDLENVGYTARHHTFFEMLGNFSFGDYFKREAIQFAWTFLTEELKIPAEKLWVTVYQDDHEAEKIWLEDIKVDPDRFSRLGESSNFWSMGDTGPCGPCTEIFYDHGPDVFGGPPGSPDEDGDRYIEIWNLVFMQYDRSQNGELTPLPKPSVDTGMGLERLTAVLQGVHTNYDTDLFIPLLKVIAQLAGMKDITHTSMRVVADHIRASAFLIADGVIPSNEGRGYVLRRIIRRAIRHGHKLGIRDIFFYKLVKPLIDKMGSAYPELTKAGDYITHILKQEEEQFNKTLEQGLRIFEHNVSQLKTKQIPGEIIFTLYDTYGFPPDLTGDIAREQGLTLDLEGFASQMEMQREKSKAASKFSVDYHTLPQTKTETTFVGYDRLQHSVKVIALLADNVEKQMLMQDDQGIIILNESPFYAESGGQVGDQGILKANGFEFIVTDTQKQGKTFAHVGYVKQGSIKTGDMIEAKVDYEKRQATALNHSATHLLHSALREQLGSHVQQKGSLVDSSRLRFDFTHFNALTADEIKRIEDKVNQEIRRNNEVVTEVMSTEKAISEGAMAIFGEKYGDDVRVLSMGEFSKELCGGTHVKRTGDIGLFKILHESAIAAGIRRIEAITGRTACDYVWQLEKHHEGIAEALKTTPAQVDEKISQLLSQLKQQEKQIRTLQQKLISGQGNDLSSKVQQIDNVQLLTTIVEDVDIKTLREMLDQWKDRLRQAVIVLATHAEGKITLIAGVTKPLCEKIPANELVGFVAEQVGGKGGGKPDLAQAGGNEPHKLAAALETVKDFVLKRLA